MIKQQATAFNNLLLNKALPSLVMLFLYKILKYRADTRSIEKMMLFCTKNRKVGFDLIIIQNKL